MYVPRYKWRFTCVHVAFSTEGAPGDFPPATDTCDTLPHDATLDAAPSSLEMALSPNHDAEAKRKVYQNQPKKKEDNTEDPSQKKVENSGVSGPKVPEVNAKEPSSGSKGPTSEEKQQMAESKQPEKENDFTESDNEQARSGPNIISTGFILLIHVKSYLTKHIYAIIDTRYQ